MAPYNVTLSAIACGKNVPFLRKVTKIKDPSTITLGQAFHDAITTKKPRAQFNERNIIKIKTASNIDVLDLVDDPIQDTIDFIGRGDTREIIATIDINLNVGVSATNGGRALTMLETITQNSRIRLTLPTPKVSIEYLLKFQQEYKLSSNKEKFLKSHPNKPDYNEQFDCPIQMCLKNANLGWKTKDEAAIFDKAVCATRVCFKLVHSVRVTLQKRVKCDRFQTFILEKTKSAERTKLMPHPVKKIRVTQELLHEWIQKFKDAASKWPDWYFVEDGEKKRKGEAIFEELENLELIAHEYLEYLRDQTGRNKDALTKDQGRKPSAKFTSFNIVKGMP
jgi:hypothetical protein